MIPDEGDFSAQLVDDAIDGGDDASFLSIPP